ncbi:MAG: OmpH family outer membrane protein, partial [Microbacteriaceae bacterium]|nr:OmpH family outer membrane protein [Microbacteriaceae bacterium]
PEMQPAILKHLLNEPISALSMHSDQEASEDEAINSGLFKDTGAATFALTKQSQTGAEGQKAISVAFSGKRISELRPPSTFPLVVDSDGSVRMPQDAGFDKKFLKEFQEALYKTNIAGIETMQIAATVEQRMDNSIKKADAKIADLNEQINSLKRSLESVSAENSVDSDRKMNQLSEQVASLLLQEQKEQLEKQRNQKIKAVAAQAKANGSTAAHTSYEIAAHMSYSAAEGIKRITAPFKGFLLKRNIAFVPHTVPVDESELYEYGNSDDPAETGKEKDVQSWTSRLFEVNQIPDPSALVDGKPIQEYWQTVPVSTVNRPLFILLSSSELLKKEASKLYICRQTPFDNGALGKSELCFLAPQCIESGKESMATWTVLMRDLVYSTTEKSGQPLQS